MNNFESMGPGVPPQETLKDAVNEEKPKFKEAETEQMGIDNAENIKKQDEAKIAEIRASLGIKNPEENNPQIHETIASANTLISSYKELTEEVRRTGKSSDPEYSTKRESMEEKMINQSAELSDKLGVNLRDVFVTDNEIFNNGREVVMLRRACGIAKEAEKLGFSKEGDVKDLTDLAEKLIQDYDAFTEPVRRTGKSEIPDYSTRAEAKQLLIESLARELATRMDSGDGIDVQSIRELSEKTGVDFSKAVRESYKLPPRKKEEKPEGRMPQIGASGIWRTSGGDVEGRVIAGRKGGPFTIETPRGKMQVDNIF